MVLDENGSVFTFGSGLCGALGHGDNLKQDYPVKVLEFENSNVEKLAKSIDSLQNLSQEEIRKIYLESLGNNKLTAKGGGGLGLIEMAGLR